MAKEEGCELQTAETKPQEDSLLQQLESTEAVVWSPYDAYRAAQSLLDLLVAERQEEHA